MNTSDMFCENVKMLQLALIIDIYSTVQFVIVILQTPRGAQLCLIPGR